MAEVGYTRLRLGRGWGWGWLCGATSGRHRTTPLPNPPPTQVGPARLAHDKTRPGQARGAWGREQTEFAARMCSLASLAEPRERVGGAAAARVDRGDARLRALDPGLGPCAGSGWNVARLRHRAGKIAASGLGLAAREDRGAVAAGRLVDAADAHELLGVELQPAQHAVARRRLGGLQQRRRERGELPCEG